MGTFKTLSMRETKELDKLLHIADDILGTTTPVIKGNTEAASIVGTAIGGATGAAIASGAGTLGVAGSAIGVTGAASFIGVGITSAAIVALPLTVIIILSAGIGWLFGKNIPTKKEKQKQANYCKEIAKKQQKVYEKYKRELEKLNQTCKEKDDIIKRQKEKIAEYEAIFEALKNKRSELERNLSFA